MTMSVDKVNLVLRAQMLVDGSGSEPVSPALVAIADRWIVYAGPAREAPQFPTARCLDLPGACLLPGMIDMHVHPTYYWEEPDSAAYTYDPEQSLVYSQVAIALLAAANLRQALMSGVTTARDTGAVGGIMPDLQRAIRKGQVLGPKVYAAGRLVTPTAGHCHFLPNFSNQADGPDGFRRAVREEIREGADLIKIANRGADMTQEELNAAVDEAHRLGKKVACHTGRPPAQRMAIDAGVDTFEHGTPTAEEIDLAVEKGIAWTPTVNVSIEYQKWCHRRRSHANPDIARQAEKEYAQTTEYLENKAKSLAYAMQVGLKIGAGTDSWSGEVRFAAMADEVRCLVDYGCSPMQALQAATSWPAEAMGWAEIGLLQEGKLADVIAVPGNPLEDIGLMDRVVLVVREGQVVKGDLPLGSP
jgi:imidazolonepropionase-like amidohydrolase